MVCRFPLRMLRRRFDRMLLGDKYISKTKKIALGGFYISLTLILVYVSNILPSSKLTFLTLASSIIPISIITTGARNTILVFLASSILLFFFGLKEMSLIYFLYFGIYGIIKYYIEKIRILPLEIFLKLLFSNFSFLILYFIIKISLLSKIDLNLPIYLLIIILQIVILIYDYSLTLILFYIKKKLKL